MLSRARMPQVLATSPPIRNTHTNLTRCMIQTCVCGWVTCLERVWLDTGTGTGSSLRLASAFKLEVYPTRELGELHQIERGYLSPQTHLARHRSQVGSSALRARALSPAIS